MIIEQRPQAQYRIQIDVVLLRESDTEFPSEAEVVVWLKRMLSDADDTIADAPLLPLAITVCATYPESEPESEL